MSSSADSLGSIPPPTTFGHTPLRNSDEQIRLVKMAFDGDAIHCELEVVDLTQAPKFYALSYLWGPAVPTSNVFVENKPLSIRRNLYLCLEEILKAPDLKHQYFWMDQVCIDQNNDQEKNHQVRLMASIYKTANSVLVWLGESTSRRLEVHAHFHRISSATKRSDSDIAAIEMLFEEEYFKRAWIKQEILLAKEVSILITAERRIPWALVRETAREKLITSDWNLGPESRLLDDDYQYPVNYIGYGLVDFCYSECANPRDKVYGLLGLVDKAQWPDIDYSKSIQQVFLDAVFAVWRATFKFSEDHTLFCLLSTQRWGTAQVTFEALSISLLTPTEASNVFNFVQAISKWGQDHRAAKQAITEMGKCSSTGLWWFKADGQIHWPYSENKRKEFTDAIDEMELEVSKEDGHLLKASVPNSESSDPHVWNPDTETQATRSLAGIQRSTSIQNACATCSEVDLIGRFCGDAETFFLMVFGVQMLARVIAEEEKTEVQTLQRPHG